MMILSQDGMVAVNSDNVAMFEVKETEALLFPQPFFYATPVESEPAAMSFVERFQKLERPSVPTEKSTAHKMQLPGQFHYALSWGSEYSHTEHRFRLHSLLLSYAAKKSISFWICLSRTLR